MPTLQEIRQQYPQYSDMPDAALADALYSKFYSDMPRAEFDKRIGIAEAPADKAVTLGDIGKSALRDVAKAIESVATLPQRAFQASENVRQTGDVTPEDAGTMLEAAGLGARPTPSARITVRPLRDSAVADVPAAEPPGAGASPGLAPEGTNSATPLPIEAAAEPPASVPLPAPGAAIEESPVSAAAGRYVDDVARQVSEADAAERLGSNRAGNINLDRIYAPDDVKAAIDQTAAENEGFIDARRGVVTFEQTRDMADLLGMSSEDLAARKLGQAFNAEQLFAARQLLVNQATKVRDLARRVEGGSDADKAAFAEAVTRLRTIQEHVSGATAEAGRALSQYRMLAGASKEDIARVVEAAKTQGIEDMARKINALEDPAKVADFTANAWRAKTSDMLYEAWINALLSGPTTHSANMISNALVAAYSIPESLTAAAVSKVTGSGIAGREAFSRVFGTLEGALDGIRAGWRAYREEVPGDATKVEGRRNAIPSATVGGFEVGGKQVRIPGRLLSAEDAFFKAIAYRQEINALAMRRALAEGGNVAERAAELRATPTVEMRTAANAFAEKQTFTNPLGEGGKALQTFVQKIPTLRFVIPFIRTPINIVKFAAERSPFAPLFKAVREDLSGAHGAVARDNAIARITLGSSVSAAAAYMAANGAITGGGPSDPAKRALMYADGWQPYSVKVGDTYYSYARGEPLGTLFGVAADAVELQHAMTEDEKANLGALILGSVSRNLVSKTWLKGPADLIEAFQDPVRYGPRYIQRQLGTVVPTGVAQYAQANDPYLREARTILDTIRSRIPGEREKLFVRRDAFGNPITREGALGPDLLSPIYMSAAKNDPTIAEMLRLKVTPGRLQRTVRGAQLTDAEYDAYARVAGQAMKAAMDRLVRLPGWRDLPEAAQVEAFQDVIRKSRDVARTQLFAQSPDLALRVAAEKLKRKRIQTGATEQ